jgi:hypothetical protein
MRIAQAVRTPPMFPTDKEIRRAVEIALRVCAEVSDDRIVLRKNKVEPFLRILELEVLDIIIRELQSMIDRLR